MPVYEWYYLLPIPLLLLGEAYLARNPCVANKVDRWVSNLGLGLCNEGLRLLLPLLASLFFTHFALNPAGEFDLGHPLASVIAAFLILDATLYGLHRLNHRITVLWRLHRAHHSDLDVDVSTALRHHPGEFTVSLATVTLVIGALGLTPAQLLPYLIAAQTNEFFAHSNIRLPWRLEKPLAWLVVTPRVHQIHHSALRQEADCNYGQVLTLWDRLFGTFIAPSPSEAPSRFGLTVFRDPKQQEFLSLLLQPLR